MAAPQTFRAAFNGFNREDVVHYIEYLNARHSTEMNQQKSELQSLKAELAQAQELAAAHLSPEETAETTDRCAALEQDCARLREELEEARCRCAALEQTRDQLAAELESVKNQLTQTHAADAKELEAYRRAERVERMAQERAAQVYRQTAEVLSDATAKVDGVAGQIGDFTQQVTGQLTQLQSAVVSSKTVLHDAAAAIAALRPETEEK